MLATDVAADALAVSTIKRQLTPHQATTLLGRKATDRPPNLVTPTLAQDMATASPLFAYLPITDRNTLEELRDTLEFLAAAPAAPAPLEELTGRFGDCVSRCLAAALASADAGPQWGALRGARWRPVAFNPDPAAVGGYHRDRTSPDTADPAWMAVPVVRRAMRGGLLHIPEYDVTLESFDGWMVVFPEWLVHAVTPARAARSNGYRYSLAFTQAP